MNSPEGTNAIRSVIKGGERWGDAGLSANEFAEQAGLDSDRLRGSGRVHELLARG